MMPQAPIDVAELPPASTYLNYPRQGPPVGKYLGPNEAGEWFTVVSSEAVPARILTAENAGWAVGVGLAYGVYTIGGVPTDPDGFPAEIALAKIRRDWQALEQPRRRG